MMRRTLLALARCAEPDPQLPADAERMNAFAAAYNEYAEGVQRGVVDLKRWQTVLKAWRRLNAG